MIVISEKTCHSILNKSGIPGVDYALNPYTGCQHGCVYCYATFMKKYTNHPEPWGGFVDVKLNAPVVLAKELLRKKPGQVMLGTVTDAYQPLEKKYEVTRQCLELLTESDFPVSILTKSSLILRDLDLLKGRRHWDVGFTITTPEDKIRRAFEPHASSVEARLEALKELTKVGVNTWVFFGPVLPYFSDSEEEIDRLFSKIKQAGAKRVLIDAMNFRHDIWQRLQRFVSQNFPEALEYYQAAYHDRSGYRQGLKQKVIKAARKHSLNWQVCY